jgi:hypothetical protein
MSQALMSYKYITQKKKAEISSKNTKGEKEISSNETYLKTYFFHNSI